MVGDVNCSARSLSNSDLPTLEQLKKENQELRKRFDKREGEVLGELLHDLQSAGDKCKSLEAQDANSTIEVLHDKIRQLEKMHSSVSK